MTARLRSKDIVLVGLGSAAVALAACTAAKTDGEASDQKKTTEASSVVVEIFDATGEDIGSCLGTLIAPKVVLTAGHCVAGVASWKVSSPAGSSKASVASTPWKNFQSDLSQPEHSDIGLIMLDDAITLDSYPQMATTAVEERASGVRFRRARENATAAVPTDTKINGGARAGFRLSYLVQALPAEQTWFDTGGAVLDSRGAIVGVVSGKGKTSGLLHVARVDNYATWAKRVVGCSSPLAARSYGGGKGGGGRDAGGWGSSSGGYGGGGKDGGTTGIPEGPENVPGSSGATGGTDDTVAGACPPAIVCEGDCGTGSGSGGSSGTNGSSDDASSGGTTSGGRAGGSGGSSTNHASGGTRENCEGSADDPDTCPAAPDGADCHDATCGGCGAVQTCIDANIDYGGAPAGTSKATLIK